MFHDWTLLWCFALLRKWGRVEKEPTVEGCIAVFALLMSLYYWLNVAGEASSLVNDVFFMQIQALSVRVLLA